MSLLSRIRHRLAGAPAVAPPESKTSRTGPVLALNGVGRPQWSPRDYGALAREGFQKNPVAYRAVRLIAEAAASVTVLAYAGDAEVADHPVLGLLTRPNGLQSGIEFFECLYGHLLIAGNAYVEVVALDGTPRELYVLRPDRMRVVPGADGWPAAYDYGSGERAVRFPVAGGAAEGVMSPILHLRLFHPTSDHYGFAPSEAALMALDIHNTASAWAKALLDNSARPSGALVYQSQGGANLSEEQFARLKQELEEGFQGARHAGRPLLLEGGLDWKSMGYSPRDMDFIEAKRESAREIALAFGVPPMLLGIPGDNTYSTYQEANRVFWRQTVLPPARRTLAALSAWLQPGFAAPFRLEIDADRIDALAAERALVWSQIGGAAFLTDDEKRAAVGYGPLVG